jgi:integrase/recombinase XerC
MNDLSPPALSLPFAEQLAAFYNYMRSERQLSIHTQTNYARDLEKFQLFCAAKALTELHMLGVNHIRMAVAQLHREGLGGKSLQRWLSSLRSLYQAWLVKKQYCRWHNCTQVSQDTTQNTRR